MDLTSGVAQLLGPEVVRPAAPTDVLHQHVLCARQCLPRLVLVPRLSWLQVRLDCYHSGDRQKPGAALLTARLGCLSAELHICQHCYKATGLVLLPAWGCFQPKSRGV